MNDMGPPPGGDIPGTIVVIVGALVTLLAFVLAFRATVWPGETASEHPKNLIFKDDH
jgi:hypothetical protein